MPWPFRRKKASPAEKTQENGRAEDVALPKIESDRRFIEHVPYMLPKDLSEVSRLDFQHYALRATIKANYLAPLGQPQQILDVGCGTGQWCYEMGETFPAAHITGFDLEEGKAPPITHFRFVAGNVLDGLPFPADRFDYVHQRLMVAAVPLTAWPGEIKDLVRVTRPGGWVELVEGGDDIRPLGPATRRIFELMSQLAASRGLDTNGVVSRSLGDYLRQAGLSNIKTGTIEIPLGQWGGRIGALMGTNFRSTFTGLSQIYQTRFQLSAEEVQRLLDAMPQEWEQQHTVYRFVYAYGQKGS